MPFTVFNVVAARPNFPKVAPIERAMRARPDVFRPVLVHTGQHYDYPMSDAFLKDLGMPAPDHHLGVGSGNHGEQTAEALKRFEALLLAHKPDMVLVVGDVNSTLACALAASKLHIPVAHVEAGLRSFDRTMPEEINRVVTDVLSDLLFVTEPVGVKHLKREGFAKSSVFLPGDVMIDALNIVLPKAREEKKYASLGLARLGYAILTMHRPGNVDDRARLTRILAGLKDVCARIPVVFPVHPRTAKRLEEFGLWEEVRGISNLHLLEPQGYVDFLSLLDGARFAITDSGGVPEECTFLGIPCLTLRNTTERPATIAHGINHLVDDDRKKLVREATKILAAKPARKKPPRGWDGHAADRIVRVIERFLTARAKKTATRKSAA
ncbi:MAG TPA: UDP-N-acetylglucosamine 2-epimerase (non-hydrolyzing) [bacterium]|nr:UDP-N-acetylglucosamine 2-epimerase (non-hydrolyzing) [bacterium]